jgi:hypothetical protein
MTIKELAYSTQQYVQTSTSVPVSRAHIYELLAAAFGFKSHAAFGAVALLADAGVGSAIPTATPGLIGRALQLGYPKSASEAIARSLADHANARQVSFIHLDEILSALNFKARLGRDDDDFDDWDDESDDVDEVSEGEPANGPELQASHFLASSLLMDGLEQAAAHQNAGAHFAIAALYRCGRPNGYLYEESLKGRVLNKIEQDWADAYLVNKPKFEKYAHHLRQAAIGGVRQAAAEYADVFDDPEFFARAEQGTGPVDTGRMLKLAETMNDEASRRKWLRAAGDEGDMSAVRALAWDGDPLALRELAESGDIDAIRELAEQAIDTNPSEAWMWQHLADLLGTDLTESTMRAYHDGGPQSGQEYDDDFGGGAYVDGNEGLELPPLSPEQDFVARTLAAGIFARIQTMDE